MCRLNLTLYLGWFLLLLSLIYYVSCAHFHIVTSTSIETCHYHTEATCITLEQLNFTTADIDSITLSFLPGDHLLPHRLKIGGIQAVTLIGLNSTQAAAVRCRGNSGFELQGIESLSIENLELTRCGGNESNGGALKIENTTNVHIKGCNFIGNHVQDYYGGALYLGNVTDVLIEDCVFHSNSASCDHCDGGAISAHESSIQNNNTRYENNTSTYGGAIYAFDVQLFAESTQFVHNKATYYGGAIYLYIGTTSNSNSVYKYNQAEVGGAMFVVNGDIQSVNCLYQSNKVKPVFVEQRHINVTGCIRSEMETVAAAGGAIYLDTGTVLSTSTNYTDNMAEAGGVMYVYLGSILNENTQYKHNTADCFGGGIAIISGRVSSNSSRYENNKADFGGAVFAKNTLTSSTRSVYTHNTAGVNGGAVSTENCSVITTDSYYINNTASYGGAIAVLYSQIFAKSITFTSNSATIYGGAVYAVNTHIFSKNNIVKNNRENPFYISSTVLVCSASFQYQDNVGEIRAFNSEIEFRGNATFTNNVGNFGGALSTVQSTITFNTTYSVTISGNRAKYGGGISLIQSTLCVYQHIEISGNTATIAGGGIYAYQSEIKMDSKFNLAHTTQNTLTLDDEVLNRVNVINNTAIQNGGGIYATASNIKITETFVQVSSNYAEKNGGAMYLDQNSKIYILKKTPEYDHNRLRVKLELSNNSASYGGGVYIADNTNTGVLCQRDDVEHTQIFESTQCFLQTMLLYQSHPLQTINYVNTFFRNNTASISGRDIYGGLLDRCSINSLAELSYHFPEYSRSLNGFDYFKATVHIEAHEQNELIEPSVAIETISRTDVEGYISSKAVQILFCFNNLSFIYPTVFVKKGETFHINVTVVDQVGNPANSNVLSSFFSESGIGRLKEGQATQAAEQHCSELEFNVYSSEESGQIQLYADGPCSNLGVSLQTVNIMFLPCTCPVGLQSCSTNFDCICECDTRLKQAGITNCSPENGTVLLEENFWITTTNKSNNSGFLIHSCPFDYCVSKPINVALTNVDKQCANNRTGILCGRCREGYSVMLGSSQCRKCSNIFLLLLIPFVLAGIALVSFILLCNITIATGTIHGLIFYANILAANKTQFLPFASPNVLTVFISWLNLDFGIKTCFYNGMNPRAKVLLQLVFPSYLFLLMILIIVLCEFSKQMSTLLGNRNPVATLCTLILLSYSKLIRTIVAALQYTFLDYPDGSRESVWLYDANELYFNVSNIPSFLAAFIILILGALYTILLFFGQWFPRCSNRMAMKWAKNTKYHAFIDAYHAPFTPKHRYWVGLLLFSQIVHNVIAALSTNGPIISAGCVALGLIMIKLLTSQIYKNRWKNYLESIFLVNIVTLAIATYYIRETNENQSALVLLSVSITFILFIGILCYHCHKYILKNTTIWNKLKQPFVACSSFKQRNPPNEHPLKNMEMAQAHIQKVHDHKLAYTSNAIDCPDDTSAPSTRNDPGQLREPYMDILIPVTIEDYKETPAVCVPARLATFSVVDKPIPTMDPLPIDDHLKL